MSETSGFVDLRVRLPTELLAELRHHATAGAGAFARAMVREQLASGARAMGPSGDEGAFVEFRFKVARATRKELRVRAARLDVTLQALCAGLIRRGLSELAAARGPTPRGQSALPRRAAQV